MIVVKCFDEPRPFGFNGLRTLNANWRGVKCQRDGPGRCAPCAEDSYQTIEVAKNIILRIGRFFCAALTAAGVEDIECLFVFGMNMEW